MTISGTGTCPQPRVEVQTYNSGVGNVDARFYVDSGAEAGHDSGKGDGAEPIDTADLPH